jgi:hypothetical protein
VEDHIGRVGSGRVGGGFLSRYLAAGTEES